MLKTQGLQSLEQIHAFLEGSRPLGFEAPGREAAYAWIADELRRFHFPRLGKADKGPPVCQPEAIQPLYGLT